MVTTIAALSSAAQAQTPAPPPAPPAAASPTDAWLPRGTADLIMLEKLRAQPAPLRITTGQSASFGSLTITLRRCLARPPDLPANSAAFLEVVDSRAPGGPATVFKGWILTNTPAVSQLEHPVYDMRLAACR